MADEMRTGFSSEDNWRVATVVEALAQYLPPGNFALGVGMALRYLLAERNLDHPSHEFKDLDLLLPEPGAISSDMAQEGSGFIFTHYHPPTHPYKYLVGNFFIKALHVPTRTKVDFFSFSPFPPGSFDSIGFFGADMMAPMAESLLVVTLLDLQKLLEANGNAPKKRLDSLKLLLQITDFGKAEEVWGKHFNGQSTLTSNIESILKLSEEQSEKFITKSSGKKPIARCGDCYDDPKFPLASREAARAALGLPQLT